jgi:hypothetical protein
MVAGLSQQPCEPGLDLTQKQTESGLLGRQSAQLDPARFDPAHNNNIIIIMIYNIIYYKKNRKQKIQKKIKKFFLKKYDFLTYFSTNFS